MSDTKVFVADDGDVYVPMSKWNEAAAEITRLRARLAAWKAVAETRHRLLLGLEWADEVAGEEEDAPCCPCCLAFDDEQHKTGCKMDEAINESARAAADAVEKNAS